MKRIATAFSLCATLFAMDVAYATDYDWTGALGTEWEDPNNWVQNDGNYPGDYSGRTDSVTIGYDSLNTTCNLNASLEGTISTLEVSAYAKDQALTLNILGSGDLTTSGLVTIWAKNSDAIDKYAKITVATDGSFAPNSMEFIGNAHATNSHAKADFDEDVTVSSSTSLQGYVDIDVADTKTLAAAATSVADSDTHLGITSPGTASVTATTLTIDADAASDVRKLTLDSGTFTTTDLVTVKGDQNDANAATISVTAGTFSPHSMHFWGRDHATDGHAIGDFDVNVAVTSATSTTLQGYVDIDLGEDVVFSTQATSVADSDTHLSITSPGTARVTATTLTIDADTPNAARKLTLDSGKLTTTGLVTVKGRLTTDQNHATIAVAAGTFSPHSMHFWGSTDPNFGYAIGDFDVGATVSNSTTIQGYVDIDIAHSTTVDLNDLTMVANSADMVVTGNTGGTASTLRLDSYTNNSRPLSLVGPLTVVNY